MLQTKIQIPSPGRNLVHRSILYEKLSKGLQHKLILVSAPAGFGKTTLLTEWISQEDTPTAWFSLSRRDNDPHEFLSYLISAIQCISDECGQEAMKLLKSANEANSESIINLLINDILNIDEDFLLILDDFHLIENGQVLMVVNYFLEYMPDHIHVVISTRSDPALPLARLRSQNQLLEIRSTDLSFSANDINDLFNKKFRFKLSQEEIYSLEHKTEGWVAGLQLAALSLQGKVDPSAFIKAFAGNNRYIMDYLIEEVLKVQPDEIKDFLLQTSILEQFSAPLCNAILDRKNSQEVIEQLESQNMFVIPLDGERKWYRYHHLFADLLKQRLLQKEKTAIEELHKKACEWFEENSMYDLAINHALEIFHYEKAIQILAGHVESMWENGLHSAIMSYGNLLPEELINKYPDFSLYYAWILITDGQIQKAEAILAFAEKITREKPGYDNKLLGKIAVAFAYLYSFEEGSDKIFHYSKVAMDNLSEDDPLWYSWGWYATASAERFRENFPECKKALQKGLDYGKKSGNIYLISSIALMIASEERRMGLYKSAFNTCSDLLRYMKESGYSQLSKVEWTYAGLFSMMAFIQYCWADLNEAHENVKSAYSLCEKEKNSVNKILPLLINSFILHGLGELNGAEEKLAEIEDILKKNKLSPYTTSSYIAWKGQLLIEANLLDQAADLLRENELTLQNEKNIQNERAYQALVRLLIAQFRFEEADALLSELYAMATAEKSTERLIELKVLYAIRHNMSGTTKEAVANLMEAMEFAAAENLLMDFVTDSDQLRDILPEVYKIQATRQTKIPGEFIKKLKLALENKEKRKDIQAESELSARELDTLKLIAQKLTNMEIAEKLFISQNTVKTHLKNIYFKLEVDSRSKAAARAKELNLL